MPGATSPTISQVAVRGLWGHRGLLRELVGRDIQNRYAGSVAGLLWGLLHPMALLGIYAVVFEYVFRAQVPGLAPDQPYLLFVASTLWPWLAVQEAITRGTMAVQNHGALVKKVAFPHELVVYSAVVSSFLVQLCGYAIVLLTLKVLGFGVYFMSLPTVLFCVAVLAVASSAVALVMGALQVFVRDVEHLLTQLLGILFYATPILYAMESVPPWLSSVMQWNPLLHYLDPIRNALLKNEGINLISAAIMLGATMLVFYGARKFFLRLSPYFEDMV
jgi:lipopolysaccharide transport system permease protein